MKLSEILPYPVWSRLQLARNWAAELPERRRIAALTPRVPRDRLAVWTAGASVPATGQPLRGGRVKLAPLQERFPGAPTEFNILYLVSSALPPAAGEWVRLARAAGARVVWNQNGIAYPGWIGRAHELINRPVRELLPQVDAVCYQSDFCRQSTDRFVGSLAKKWLILYNSVDTDTFTPTSSPLPPRPLALLSAGTQQSAYRVRAALATLAALRKDGVEAQLTVAGAFDFDGGRGLVERMMAELGVPDVALVGPYGRDAAPDLYRAAHILLHPKYKDPCPSTVIEAMACGVPVVGTASGGLPELVGEDAGRLIPVRDTWDEDVAPDAAEMAAAVKSVSAALPLLSAAARRRAVERFDQRVWLDRHEALFRELTGVSA